jgi:hypothetical protein
MKPILSHRLEGQAKIWDKIINILVLAIWFSFFDEMVNELYLIPIEGYLL